MLQYDVFTHPPPTTELLPTNILLKPPFITENPESKVVLPCPAPIKLAVLVIVLPEIVFNCPPPITDTDPPPILVILLRLPLPIYEFV